MNGLGLFLLLVATVGQIGNTPEVQRPPETDFGWEIHPNDGVLEYIIQVSPDEMEMLTKFGKEKTSAMPPELVGRATRIVVRIGSTVLPRTPTLQEIERSIPIVGSSTSNANFPVPPAGYSADNMKTVESPAVYNVAGNNPPTLPNTLGNSAIPNRNSTSDQGQRLGNQTGLPVIPSLAAPDSSLLAQNGTGGSKFLESARDPLGSSRLPAAVQNSDKFNSAPPTQNPAQLPAAQTSPGASGGLADRLNRDWPNVAPQTAPGNLPSTTGRAPVGTNGLSGTNGMASQTNPAGTFDRYGQPTTQSTIPNYGQPAINSPAASAEGWMVGNNNGQMASQQYALPSAQPIPQSPLPNFGGAPNPSGVNQGYNPNAYGSPQNYPTNATAFAQNPGYSPSAYQGSQSGMPNPNYATPSAPVAQQPYDARFNSDSSYVDRVAMSNTPSPGDLPSTSLPRSNETSNSRLENDYDNRRSANTLSSNGRGDIETAGNVDGILQVFFLLSLVVNFYLGLLIRKLLARYRSLLSSVRSQTA